MRQAGVLAAAGLVAMRDMVGRLEVDHANARVLAGNLPCIWRMHCSRLWSLSNVVSFLFSFLFIDQEPFWYCFQNAFSKQECVIAEGLNAVKGLHVNMPLVETNIVSALIYLNMQLLLLFICC
jgi:threonine aldolase